MKGTSQKFVFVFIYLTAMAVDLGLAKGTLEEQQEIQRSIDCLDSIGKAVTTEEI